MFRWILHFWTTEIILLEEDLSCMALMNLQLSILLLTAFSARCFSGSFFNDVELYEIIPTSMHPHPEAFLHTLSLKVLEQQLSHLYTSTPSSN